jgi:prepilin-type N-terminal cleavage/methylation domain-containing protein/prepilin-type processing-associated H-X9-DG protein
MAQPNHRRGRGFTLVELLVVIGIIALLLAMLLPAVSRARGQAISVKCKAQMRDIGVLLSIYAQENRGVLYPIGDMYKDPADGKTKWKTLGYEPNEPDLGRARRWPVPVFKITDEYTKGTYNKGVPITSLKVTNPESMKCPADIDPVEDHTYILNKHLAVNYEKGVKLGGRVRNADGAVKSSSDVVLMGEKKTSETDYYMEATQQSEFDRVVEPYRHGLKLGSNYLFLDWHVDVQPPKAAKDSMDSWDAIGGDPGAPPATP